MTSLVRIRPVTEAEADAVRDLDQWAFALPEGDLDPELSFTAFEWDRTYGAELADGAGLGVSGLAGLNTTYSLDLAVPGGAGAVGLAPCAALSWVGVHPAARRRGILTAMIGHHFEAVRQLGREAISVLWASEPTIYGRFGYGLASRHVQLTVPRGAELRSAPGADRLRVRIEHAIPERHTDLVGDCYDSWLGVRPGAVSRPTAAWRRLAVSEHPGERRGAESLRIAIAEDSATGQVRGYALFRRKGSMNGIEPNGEVLVKEAIGLDPAATSALWQRLTDFDLMASTASDFRALDDPLLHLLADRDDTGPRLLDALWVRLVDVPRALAQRRYRVPVRAVLAVRDRRLPENTGRWLLDGGPDGAACTPAPDGAPVDLSLDVRELGSAYLGGLTLTGLAAAGLVEAPDPDRLAAVSAAFESPLAPLCTRIF